MNENYANDMALKLKRINLIEDEQRFTDVFMSIPLPPPPLAPPAMSIATPSANLAAIRNANTANPGHAHAAPSPSDIPRTLSMPPAYESQGSAGLPDLVGNQYHGAASTNMLPNAAAGHHSRQITLEVPSQP